MSQAGIISTASSPVPPAVPTSFTTQNGTAIPLANVLIINAIDSTEDNDNGIIAKGGVVGTGTSNEVDVVITNRLQGASSATGAVTTDIITFALAATPTVYRMFFDVVGRETTSGDGLGYSLFASIKTNGVAATVVKEFFDDVDEDTSLEAGLIEVLASGNNMVLRATGVAGKTITYKAVGTYVAV